MTRLILLRLSQMLKAKNEQDIFLTDLFASNLSYPLLVREFGRTNSGEALYCLRDMTQIFYHDDWSWTYWAWTTRQQHSFMAVLEDGAILSPQGVEVYEELWRLQPFVP